MKLTRNNLLILTGILLLVVLFGWIDVLELRAEEPRRAVVSMEMLLRGEFIVPQLHNWGYYNKPPLFNWWMILFFKLFGSYDEWVVRLPSLISFLITALASFFIVRKYLDEKVALWTSLFFVTSADLLFYGTVNSGEIDLFFSLLVFLQATSIFIFFEKKQLLCMFILSYILAALGALTKGLPALAFQALTLMGWLVWNKQWRLLFSWKHFLGIGMFMLIMGAYFFQYAKQEDLVGFLVSLFKESAQRSGLEHDFLDILKQSLVFPFYLIQLLLPWSLFGVFFFRKDFLDVLKKHSILKFALLFILINIPLYWFAADHKARYLYMFFPFICLLLAYYFVNISQGMKRLKRGIEQVQFWIMVLLSLFFVVLPFVPQTADLPFLWPKVILLLLLGGVLAYLFKSQANFRWYFLVNFLLMMRLGFNWTYLPAAAQHSKTMIYKSHISEVLTITGNNPVHLAGEPYIFEPDASIGPFTFEKVKLISAPLIAYQVPYYLSKGNGHIMQFDSTLLPSTFYFAYEEDLDFKPEDILYRFRDQWLKKDLILFKSD